MYCDQIFLYLYKKNDAYTQTLSDSLEHEHLSNRDCTNCWGDSATHNMSSSPSSVSLINPSSFAREIWDVKKNLYVYTFTWQLQCTYVYTCVCIHYHCLEGLTIMPHTLIIANKECTMTSWLGPVYRNRKTWITTIFNIAGVLPIVRSCHSNCLYWVGRWVSCGGLVDAMSASLSVPPLYPYHQAGRWTWSPIKKREGEGIKGSGVGREGGRERKRERGQLVSHRAWN